MSSVPEVDIYSTGSAAVLESHSLAHAMGREQSNHWRALDGMAAANSLVSMHSSLSATAAASVPGTVQPQAHAAADDALPPSSAASVAASSSSCKQRLPNAAPKDLQSSSQMGLQASNSSGDLQGAHSQHVEQAEHSMPRQEPVGSENAMLPLELPSPLQDSCSSDSRSSGPTSSRLHSPTCVVLSRLHDLGL